MKNNIDYYQHFATSHEHPKFKLLRSEYGWAGEGMFWALNNEIAKSENCELDISRKFILANLLDLFRMTKEDFEKFLNFLVEECELIIRNGDIITTEIVQENFGKVIEKRKKNKSFYEKKSIQKNSVTENEIQSTENEIQSTENIQSKVKKSKVKENKEYIQEKSFNLKTSSSSNLKLISNRNKEKEEDDDDFPINSQVQNIWIRTVGKNPNLVQAEDTQSLLRQYGEREVLSAFRQAARASPKNITAYVKKILQNEKQELKNENPREFFIVED